MLSRRLTLVVTGSLLVTACAGVDGTERGAIRENVVEPGITAIDESRVLACGAEATAFRTAMDAYELFEGEATPDEQALVDGGFLRSTSDLWDVVDGRLVPQDPACGDVPATVPTADIVTDGRAGLETVDEFVATFSDDDIASVGGAECARELAVLIVGAQSFLLSEGRDATTIDEIRDAGHLTEPMTRWQLDRDAIRPSADSGCIDFSDP